MDSNSNTWNTLWRIWKPDTNHNQSIERKPQQTCVSKNKKIRQHRTPALIAILPGLLIYFSIMAQVTLLFNGLCHQVGQGQFNNRFRLLAWLGLGQLNNGFRLLAKLGPRNARAGCLAHPNLATYCFWV